MAHEIRKIGRNIKQPMTPMTYKKKIIKRFADKKNCKKG